MQTWISKCVIAFRQILRDENHEIGSIEVEEMLRKIIEPVLIWKIKSLFLSDDTKFVLAMYSNKISLNCISCECWKYT